LATITSEAEDDFLFQHFGDRQNGWIGASDAEVEGEWHWVAGPEKGLLFWQGDSQGSARGFTAWRIGEPNNSFPSSQDPPNEDYATWNFANEGWNDLPNDPKKTVFRPQAYLVEYSPAGPSAAQERYTESWLRSPRSLPPDAVTVVDNETLGYYNDSLGTVLDGTEEVFLLGGRTGWEPRFRPAPEPRLTAATKYLGAWLKDDPLPLGLYWSGPERIPPAWPVNTETAIIYPFVHRGPQHLELVAEFSVDNGFFVWLDGEYKFGSIERGGTRATVPLGAVPSGKHFIQVLRVDHGVVDGYRARIVGRPAPPSGAAGRPPPSIPKPASGRAALSRSGDEIRELIKEVQSLSEAVERLQRRVDEVKTMLGRRDRARLTALADRDHPEVHIVGIYEGDTETGDEVHGPRALVHVDRPGRKVILVLTSYGPVKWEVSLGDDTSLEKVILGGRGPQEVKGLPGDIPMEKPQETRGRVSLSSVYRMNSPAFPRLVRWIADYTGRQQIASFHGVYRPEEPVVIDRVQEDPQLSATYPEPTPLTELPGEAAKLTFKAHHYLPTGPYGHGLDASYGGFTLEGPKIDTLVPLPKGVMRIAYDPTGEQYYGIAGHGVAKVDLKRQQVAEMELGLDVPPISWPCEITFDTKRRRVILGSSGGGGYLYAYSPDDDRWSVISKRPGAFDAFGYSEREDCLYGVLFEYDGEANRASLAKVSAQGAVLRKIPLRGPVAPGSLTTGPGVSSTRVVPVGEYVVILTTPGGLHGRGATSDSYIYLVDPETGRTWVTSKRGLAD
jgi:hypothetical protein